jgi:catechol 2,3-dioxygenase
MTQSQSSKTPIHPNTTVGPVALTVHRLEKIAPFYRDVVGLHPLILEDHAMVLGTRDSVPLVALLERADAPQPAANATGLYHLALLLPSRADLARWFVHAFPFGIRIGQSDHGTHEAFYMADPEGNGIEIYQDWPAAQWPMNDGMVQDQRQNINLRELLNTQTDERVWDGAPLGTRMGHVHLKAADVAAIKAFYGDLIGFNITVDHPTAVFAAAGSYHHHLGSNTWRSLGGPIPAHGSRGLDHFTIELPDANELQQLEGRLRAAGVETESSSDGFFVRDPAGNGLLIVHEAPSARWALRSTHP